VATVEKVMKLLRDQRVRPFVLDIETDSTIAPDENAQKQRATEFVTAFGGIMREALPTVQAMPQAGKLLSEALKFMASQFRAGRQMEGVIEEFADDMAMLAQQPKQDPMAAKGAAEAQAVQQSAQIEAQRFQLEQQKTQMDQQAQQMDQQRKDAEAQAAAQREDQRLQADMQIKEVDEKRKATELQAKLAQMDADDQRKAQEHLQKLDLGALAIEKLRLEIEGVQIKTAAAVATTEAKIDQTETQTDNAIRTTDASVQATADSTAIKKDQAEHSASIAERKAKEPA